MATNHASTDEYTTTNRSATQMISDIPSSDPIIAHIASRFYESINITRLSSNTFAVLNNYDRGKPRSGGWVDRTSEREIFELVECALIRLKWHSENQTFMFLGERGSGKSTIRNFILDTILGKCTVPVSTALTLATSVFDMLTTVKTTSSKASKVGLLCELQYDTSDMESKLVGGSILSHNVQQSQILDGLAGECSFEILCLLVAGASKEEQEHLGLKCDRGSTQTWRYLSRSVRLRKTPECIERFELFKSALWELNFQPSEVTQICEVLAVVIHIGQLEFQDSATYLDGENDQNDILLSEGLVQVKNKKILGLISQFLAVEYSSLEKLFQSQTKRLNNETVTIVLDSEKARLNADNIASTLYAQLLDHVLSKINKTISAPDDSIFNTVSLVDFPGFSLAPSPNSAMSQLIDNSTAEYMWNLHMYDRRKKGDILAAEEIGVEHPAYFDNSQAMKDLFGRSGLFSILNQHHRFYYTDTRLFQSLRSRFNGESKIIHVNSQLIGTLSEGSLGGTSTTSFTVKHYAAEIEYPINGMMSQEWELIPIDLRQLIRSSMSEFVIGIFEEQLVPNLLSTQAFGEVVETYSEQIHESAQPLLHDLVSEGDVHVTNRSTIIDNPEYTSTRLLRTLRKISQIIKNPNANTYSIFCLNSNDRGVSKSFNTACVRSQILTLAIPELVESTRCADFNMSMPLNRFISLAAPDMAFSGHDRGVVEAIVRKLAWPKNEALVDSTRILLSEARWMALREMTKGDVASLRGLLSSDRDMSTRQPEIDISIEYHGLSSHVSHPYGTGSGHINRAESPKPEIKFKSTNNETREASKMASLSTEDSRRKLWIFMVYTLTFFIPDFSIRHLGRMSNRDVRTAWREKVAINIIIWLCCAVSLFVVIFLPLLICPKQDVFNDNELSTHNGKKHHKRPYVAIRGEVFDLSSFIPNHYPPYLSSRLLSQYAGMDVTSLFPVQVSALCAGVSGSISDTVTLDYKPYNYTTYPEAIDSQELYAQYHDFRSFTNDSRPDWFTEQMIMLRSKYKKGNMGYSSEAIRRLSRTKHRSVAILGGRVYDMTSYIAGGRRQYTKEGKPMKSQSNVTNFMDDLVVQLFQQDSGEDVTASWRSLDIERNIKERMKVCLDNLFYVGDLDTRSSSKCKFAEWFPLVVSVLLCSVIAFKFASSLQLGSRPMPENKPKFLLCQIPAYTEDEDSLRRAIDSITRMTYDDKHKLLVIVCDGLVVGEGNDRSTPRIVLDILGIPEGVSPKPLAFESISQDALRENRGQVFSGLYEAYGHLVPFLVIVKVGNPSELSRPGNRGKRDSQMIMMRFLNRVHYELPMSALELEIYHHMNTIIGVNPALYEFILQIDADTVVAKDAAMHMVAEFLHDTRLLAVCGETAISNAKATWVTMMQVYEYFISHNLMVQPMAIAYIIYMIVEIIRNPKALPIIAIVILVVVYGIPLLTFLIRRKWEMAGWMIVYLASLPMFSLYLPLYSFWHMDDFHWGNTRLVARGDNERAMEDDASTEGMLVTH